MTHKCYKCPLEYFYFSFVLKSVFLLNRIIDWLTDWLSGEKQSCITAEFNT